MRRARSDINATWQRWVFANTAPETHTASLSVCPTPRMILSSFLFHPYREDIG